MISFLALEFRETFLGNKKIYTKTRFYYVFKSLQVYFLLIGTIISEQSPSLRFAAGKILI
jgi:hypothetical protein